MHKARAVVIGHVIASEEGHVEFVSAVMALERVIAMKTGRIDIINPFCLGNFRRGFHALPQFVRDNQLLADPRPRRQFGARLRIGDFLHRRHFVEAVGDFRPVTDRPVAGDCPRRCCPDDNRRPLPRLRGSCPRSGLRGGVIDAPHPGFAGPPPQAGEERLLNRKLHPNRRRCMIVILDLGLSQRCLLDRRPHHRL